MVAICAELRCQAVVAGRVKRRGSRYTATVTVYDASSGDVIGRGKRRARGRRRLKRAGSSLGSRVLKLVRKALAEIHQDDVLLLDYVYVQRLKQKDVAAIFRISQGNIVRRRQKAIERFRGLVEEEAQESLGDSSYEGVLEEIMEDPKAFADALCEALEEMRKDES